VLFTALEYKSRREHYSYSDPECKFEIVSSPFLDSQFNGEYEGIFPKEVPPPYSRGINLRRLEIIAQAVFAAANHAESDKAITPLHIANLKEIILTIIHWKMASQGGRAELKVNNTKNKWKDETANTVINAYRKRDLKSFEIGGVRIPTATAFLRFLFPGEYGIMDSRVVKITQRNNITQLDLRYDGYINDNKENRDQYNKKYNSFLVAEARNLNDTGVLFKDVDEHGNTINAKFRPCDIEMALFETLSLD
jgi:hypothetical protein